MKSLRLAVLLLACSTVSFGASKEMIELQRDVALLQDKMNTMQRTLDEKFSAIQVLLQQQADSSARTSNQVTSIPDLVNGAVSKQLTPIATLNQRLETNGEDVRALKDTINDLNARLERMDAKITDLKNSVGAQQNPISAPPAQGQPMTQQGLSAPNGSNPPPPQGMSAEKAYTDAARDMQTGNAALAQKEFQDYLTYFPNTEQSPNAQYYIGEIAYNQGDYAGSIKSFDAVLERYPENPKTPDAKYMKGRALLKNGQRNLAVKEFRDLIANYPRTDDARKAQDQLRQLALANPAVTPRRRP